MRRIISPDQHMRNWIGLARKWVGRRRRRQDVIVVGDIIHDHNIEAIPMKGRGKFGLWAPYEYPNSPERNNKMLGGAAKAFEFIRNFTQAQIIGNVGNDPEGRWIRQRLRNLQPCGIKIAYKREISTPSILRVFSSDPARTDQRSERFRLHRYDREHHAKMGIDESRFDNIREKVKLVLIYDHGLGAITAPLLNRINNMRNSPQRTFDNQILCTVARLKHSDITIYQKIELNALILDWPDAFEDFDFPRLTGDISDDLKGQKQLKDYLREFPKCRNFIFIGENGEILLQSRIAKTALDAKLFVITKETRKPEGRYYSGAGHIFTAMVGLALASSGECTPQGAVAMGLIAAIYQRQKDDTEVLTRDELHKYMNAHEVYELVGCREIHTFTDPKSREITTIIQDLSQKRRISLIEVTSSNKLGLPVKSDMSLRFINKLIEAARGKDSVVWIYGNSGTGKTRHAKLLHSYLGRTGPYFEFDCQDYKNVTIDIIRDSFLEARANGTLVLDEIGWEEENVAEIRNSMRSILDKVKADRRKDTLLIFTSRQNPDDLEPKDFIGRVQNKGMILSIPNFAETFHNIPYLVCEYVKDYNRGKQKQRKVKRITVSALARLLLYDYGGTSQRKLDDFLKYACPRAGRRDKCIHHNDMPGEVKDVYVAHVLRSTEEEKTLVLS